MDKTKPAAPPPRPARAQDWRESIYRNRGALLLPVAILLIVFGRPTLLSAEMGLSLAVLGEILRIWAVGYSGETTRGSTVQAPQLVTAGPYALMRNPLYVGNTIIAIGFTIAFSGGIPLFQAYVLLAVIMAIVIGVYSAIIPLEEEYLARAYAMKYTEYTTLVPRFIPWRGPLAKVKQQGTWRANVVWNAESITLMFFVLTVVVVIAKLTVLGRYTVVI